MTTAPLVLTLAELEAFDSPREIGVGEYRTIEQSRIDAFAEATDDRQWIHTDPERAKTTPFRGTIAHGFLTLSLLPWLLHDVIGIRGISRALNMGLKSVSFPAIVPSGANVRARVRYLSSSRARDGALDVVWRIEVECRGQLRPSCIAEWTVRYYA